MSTGGYQPLFSVIIPSFNTGKYIANAIESVLRQSCEDFEILIQDDGSKDKTEDIVRDYKDPRISYKKNDENLGIFNNLNALCRRARGQYIKVLCADDMLAPHCLRTIKAVLDDHDEKPKVISVKESSSDACLNALPLLPELHLFSINRNNLFRFLCEKDNWGGGLAELCVERTYFRGRQYFGNCEKGLDFSRDIIVWFEMALDTDVLMINEPLVYQRSHSGQARYKLPRINQLREMFEFFYDRENDLAEFNSFAAGRKQYLDRYLIAHYWYGVKYFFLGGGSAYLSQVSWLKQQYNHGDISWETVASRFLEKCMPIKI